MANYYVDLSQVGTGAGTTVSPYNFSQLMSNSPAGGVFYIKGQVTAANISVNASDDLSWIEWDPATNGPWRMNTSTNDYTSYSATTFLIRGGIINFSNVNMQYFEPLNLIFVSCILYMPYCPTFSPSCTFTGCTLQTNQLTTPTAPFVDCVIIASDISSLGNPTFNNCVCNFTGSFLGSNSQFNWTPPSQPAWNASQASFSSAVLSVGINTPPEPGHSPYTGYALGLWGTARTGIGAMDFPASAATSSFNVSSAGDGTVVYSSISPTSMISSIQAAFPGDTYFDSTNKLGKVYVTYTHQAGREQKVVIHDAVNHTGSVSWSPYALDGTWQKNKIVAFDRDGAQVTLNRAQIGTAEDITHSSGAIHLNT